MEGCHAGLPLLGELTSAFGPLIPSLCESVSATIPLPEEMIRGTLDLLTMSIPLLLTGCLIARSQRRNGQPYHETFTSHNRIH